MKHWYVHNAGFINKWDIRDDLVPPFIEWITEDKTSNETLVRAFGEYLRPEVIPYSEVEKIAMSASNHRVIYNSTREEDLGYARMEDENDRSVTDFLLERYPGKL